MVIHPLFLDFLSIFLTQIPGDTEQSRSPSPPAHGTLTLRALVSTKDAGVIIGKAGKNVADLREQTGVKAGVSKVIQGVHERVLTVSGSVEAVSKVCLFVLSYKVPCLTFPRLTTSLLHNSSLRHRRPQSHRHHPPHILQSASLSHTTSWALLLVEMDSR